MKKLLLCTLLAIPAAAQNLEPLQVLAQIRAAERDRVRVRVIGPHSRDDDGVYDAGTRALDNNRWEEAVQRFSEAADRKGSRADGALYWKAYAENRLGKRDEALATLAALRKDYGASRWLNDAQALEVEVKQQAGKPVSPDAESNEDLKMLALNGLLHSDPEQALPIMDKLLKSNNTPRVKERALFVLTQSNSPTAQKLLMDIARGGGNPDLQMKAIRYIGISGNKQGRQDLMSIYNSSPDVNVKRAILRTYITSPSTSIDPLAAIARTEKNPELRREAIRTLGIINSSPASDVLVSLYSAEQDPEIRKEVVNSLFIQKNVKALIDLARKETNPTLKQEIVQRLSVMRSKESTAYLVELLNK